jgi:hypothetical protein
VQKQSRKLLVFLPVLSLFTIGATTPQAWRLTDKFKTVSPGQWVRLRYSGGSQHLLLAAAKDDKTVTLEERVREEGYLTSWTQTVIDLKKGLPVVLRERMPEGEIREIKLESDKVQLDDDFQALLAARFWQEPGTVRVVVPAGVFSCQVYRAVYNKKLIRIFLSKEIPLYPVKVLIPNYQLTISLTAYGKGMESRFYPKEESSPPEGTGETGSEEDATLSPESLETARTGKPE